MSEFLAMLPQVITDGLTLGFVYALVALGYTMIYGVLEFINFAHSEVFMFGAFVGTEVLLALQAFGWLNLMSPFIALAIALLVGMILAGLLGVSMERIAYRPLRGAPRLVPLISAIGVSFFLQDGVRMVEGLWHNAFYLSAPSMFPGTIKLGPQAEMSFRTAIMIATCLLIMLSLSLFVSRSRLGKALRAVAQDRSTSSLMGINVDRIISLTFLIGAGLGGAAGTLFAVQYTLIHPYVGFILGIKAFTAAVFGGIGSIPGAMLGGVLLGLFEAFAASYLGLFTGGAFGAEYKDVVAFIILILVLIFKPSGLLGQTVAEKA
jgi:branched-chain amino acid transport system permease protein